MHYDMKGSVLIHQRLQRRVWWGASIGVSALITWLMFTLQGQTGFSLWDEGFLWYGVQRILQGDLPIRDFFAYDVGRYLWLALGMTVWGDNGLVAFRFGLATMQIVVLMSALLLFRRTALSLWAIPIVSLVISLWAWPAYRMPDMMIVVVAVAALTVMQRYAHWTGFVLGTGILYGLATILVGDMRKHIAFFVFGMLVVAVSWLLRRRHWRQVFAWLGDGLVGLSIGVLPLLGFALAQPEFGVQYWEHMVVGFWQRETANIPLPYPWVWSVPWSGNAYGWLVGLLFTVFVIACPMWLGWLWWRSWQRGAPNPIVLASVGMIPPYITYVLSRADLAHLTQGMLLVVLAWIALAVEWHHWRRWLALSGVVVVSVLVMLPAQPWWECRYTVECRTVRINADEIDIPGPIADEIDLIQRFGNQYLQAGGQVYIAPFWPGAYSILNTRSPVWEIYAIWPRDEHFQQREIDRLEVTKPAAVLLKKEGLDGAEERRFRNTHSMMYDYLRKQYRPVPNFTLLPGYTIMERRK